MAGQEKAGLRSSDSCTEAEELAGTTTFVSSVEGEPVLVVEGVGISATAFAATSNLGFGECVEGRTSDDADTVPPNAISSDNEMHTSDIVSPLKGKAVADVRLNAAHAGLDTDVEIMSSEEQTQFNQVGCLGNNEHSDNVMPTTNEKARIDDEASINDRLLVQTEYIHHESLPSELEFHANKGAPSDAAPPISQRLFGAAEVITRDGVLAAADVIGHEGGSVDGNFVETTGDMVNSRPSIMVDDVSFTDDIVKDEGRMCSEAGGGVAEKTLVAAAPMSSAAVAVKASVDTVHMVDDKGSGDSISSPLSEMRLSSDATIVVNESQSGNSGPISFKEPSADILHSTQAATSADAGPMVNGTTITHSVSSQSVGAVDVVIEKAVGDVGPIIQEKLLAGAVLNTDTKLSANAGTLLEEKAADDETTKDAKSLVADGHAFETNTVANASLDRDLAPSTDITPSNNLTLSAKAQGPEDPVPIMVPLDLHVSETSTYRLPSIEPTSPTGAVTDGVPGFFPQQDDAAQADVYRGGGELLVGQKVKKRFGRRKYMGEVVGFDPETHWYKVTYEDGDEEDLEWDELEPILLQSKAGSIVIRRRRRRSRFHVGELRRSFKRVRRPGGPRASRGRGRAISNSEMRQSLESHERKDDDKEEHDDENFSMTDSADRPSSPMRTTRKRHSEDLHGTPKRRKLQAEDALEKEQTIGSRIRNRLIMEAKHHGQSDSIEGKVSTRRNSVSSASNLEGISGSNVDVEKSTPEFHDSAKSESLESSDKNAPPQGGGVILIGRKTKKDFGGQFYEGEVVSYDFKAKYYKVKYEDGDEEELEWSELEPTLVPSDQKPLSFKSMLRARNLAATRQPHRTKIKDQYVSNKDHAAKMKQALGLYEGWPNLSEQQKRATHISRTEMNAHVMSASVLEDGNEDLHGKEDSSGATLIPVGSFGLTPSPPRPLAAARFASAGDADIYEYFSWGEVTGFDKAKCPELRAAKLLPTASSIVHLAASQHHLAAITATGQVWLWRNRHGNIHTRCNEWEHLASLEEKEIVLVDIAGPDLDRASGGYEADQEDQVPDTFYLVAVSASGEDFILQGSQPQEPVRTYQLSDEPRYLGLKGVLSQLDYSSLDGAGKIVQVSVGTVEAPDESPFIGYITDIDHVYIRSATRDYMEEVNLVTGYTGKPIKIQCGRVYHAIIMTDDGRAWTWGRGYYPGLNSSSSSGFPAATCQPAVGTLVGRKVIDVGCYGEDFIALTSDGDVHQWTHAVPNPAAGVYNVPATPLYGQGPCIPHGEKLRQVSIGAGMCAGITDGGRVHTWRTAMKGGLVGILVPEREALTPLGHEENHKDTTIVSLGHRTATKVMCVAGSLIVVVKKKVRSRMGPRKKPEKNATESGMGGHSLGH